MCLPVTPSLGLFLFKWGQRSQDSTPPQPLRNWSDSVRYGIGLNHMNLTKIPVLTGLLNCFAGKCGKIQIEYKL